VCSRCRYGKGYVGAPVKAYSRCRYGKGYVGAPAEAYSRCRYGKGCIGAPAKVCSSLFAGLLCALETAGLPHLDLVIARHGYQTSKLRSALAT